VSALLWSHAVACLSVWLQAVQIFDCAMWAVLAELFLTVAAVVSCCCSSISVSLQAVQIFKTPVALGLVRTQHKTLYATNIGMSRCAVLLVSGLRRVADTRTRACARGRAVSCAAACVVFLLVPVVTGLRQLHSQACDLRSNCELRVYVTCGALLCMCCTMLGTSRNVYLC
jgi:hypothetical protein